MNGFSKRVRVAARGGLALLMVSIAGGAVSRDANASLPPWLDPDDVPLPEWVRSIAPKKDEVPIFVEPGRAPVRRGTLPRGARLPIFASRRGPGCVGRWLEVGPFAWTCSDQISFVDQGPLGAPFVSADVGDGLPFRYFFVGAGGAFAWERLESVNDDQPDQELEPGFAVAAVEERTAGGERFVRTSKGKWMALRDLGAAHPSGFSGEQIAGEGASPALEFGWVLADKIAPRTKPSGPALKGALRTKFERVAIAEIKSNAKGLPEWLRVSKDGEPAAWLPANVVARPRVAPRPSDVEADERWVDVELASQTLVAYEGDRPVFATLVSTGRGPQGSDTATPVGSNRIWVKLHSSTMDNLERREADESEGDDIRVYSLDDVPYVQFFNKAVALHGVFWHRNFGRVQSHGCVNLAPKDAKFLFGWTLPHLPRGWSAVLPAATEKGTLIRVR